MPPFLRKLTFHRAANTALPEAFVFERQRYVRHEGDAPVHEAEFPWTEELLGWLARLQRDAGDVDARRRVGATLRDFLKAVAWELDEEALEAAGDRDGPAVLTICASAAELFALPWELALTASNRCLGDHPRLL